MAYLMAWETHGGMAKLGSMKNLCGLKFWSSGKILQVFVSFPHDSVTQEKKETSKHRNLPCIRRWPGRKGSGGGV